MIELKKLYLGILSVVFITTSSFVSADVDLPIDQMRAIDSMSIQELQDRKIYVEAEINRLQASKKALRALQL